MKLLNVGCGKAAHPDWVNVDMRPVSPEIIVWDIRDGLPFPDSSFDVCYSSHLLEHLKRREVLDFLSECRRVLKRQGIIRVAVPDLEAIAALYLRTLRCVESGDKKAEADYDWMMLEMYDQAVRTFPGGELGAYLQQPDKGNEDFLISRFGQEVLERLGSQDEGLGRHRLRAKIPRDLSRVMRRTKLAITRAFLRILRDKELLMALEEGLFRRSGEVHQWMYDRFSLRRILENRGFVRVMVCQAHESQIPNFGSYQLDVVGHDIRKPDSLFMEGVKI